MRFGKIENNQTAKFVNFVFALLVFFNCAAFTSCQTKEQKVQSALKRCQQFLDKDDLANAVKCNAEAVINYPENSDEISKTGDDAFFGKCVEYKNKKDVKNALICFYAAVGLLPDKANVHFQLADSYFQYARQEQETTRVLDKDLLNRAEAAVKKGLEISPEDAPAHALYGDILDGKNEIEKALQRYRQAAKLAPKDGVFWTKLAIAEEKSGYNEMAVSSYQQAIEINPDDTAALWFLGKLYEKTGKFKNALETLEKYSKIKPPTPETVQKIEELKKRLEQERSSQKPAQEIKQKTKTVGQPNTGSCCSITDKSCC